MQKWGKNREKMGQKSEGKQGEMGRKGENREKTGKRQGKNRGRTGGKNGKNREKTEKLENQGKARRNLGKPIRDTSGLIQASTAGASPLLFLPLEPLLPRAVSWECRSRVGNVFPGCVRQSDPLEKQLGSCELPKKLFGGEFLKTASGSGARLVPAVDKSQEKVGEGCGGSAKSGQSQGWIMEIPFLLPSCLSWRNSVFPVGGLEVWEKKSLGGFGACGDSVGAEPREPRELLGWDLKGRMGMVGTRRGSEGAQSGFRATSRGFRATKRGCRATSSRFRACSQECRALVVPKGASRPSRGVSGPPKGALGPPKGASGPLKGCSGPPQGGSGPPKGAVPGGAEPL